MWKHIALLGFLLIETFRNRYLILDVLGQGTFGQVVKCQNLKTQEVVAVKVVKNSLLQPKHDGSFSSRPGRSNSQTTSFTH